MANPSPNWNLAKSKLPPSQAIPNGDIYVDVRLKTTLPDNPKGYLPLIIEAKTPEEGSLLQYAVQSNGKVTFRAIDEDGFVRRQFNNIQELADSGYNFGFPINPGNINIIKDNLNDRLITGTQEKIISSVSTPVPDTSGPGAAPGPSNDEPAETSSPSPTISGASQDIGEAVGVTNFPTGKEGNTLRYPKSIIENSTDYLLISIAKYERSGLIRGSNDGSIKSKEGQKSSIGNIILPIPSNIQDGNSVSYADGTLDGITAGVVGGAYDIMTTDSDGKTAEKLLQSYKEKAGEAFNNVADAGLKGQILRSLAVQAASIIPGVGAITPEQLLTRQTGGILNPNMELLFNGVALRSFKFSFKMTPRNGSEANEIKEIIRYLKINMAPQTLKPDSFLRTPNVFDLQYMKGTSPHPFLHRFKTCALTDMSVNYTGEGLYASYSDATPVSMVMDLTFKELEPIYNTDYESVGGVGY